MPLMTPYLPMATAAALFILGAIAIVAALSVSRRREHRFIREISKYRGSDSRPWHNRPDVLDVFQVDKKRLDGMYVQSLDEQPAETVSRHTSETTSGSLSLGMEGSTAKADHSRMIEQTSQLMGRETDPTRMIAAFEDRLESRGAISWIDFTGDSLLDSLIEELSGRANVIGLHDMPEVEELLRQKWAEVNRGRTAGRFAGIIAARRFVSLRARFEVVERPDHANPTHRLHLRAVAESGPNQDQVIVNIYADGSTVDPGRFDLLDESSVQATVAGWFALTSTSREYRISAVYGFAS